MSDAKPARLAFSQAHNQVWQTVRKLGGETWNLLHHPQRNLLIQAVADAVAELQQKAVAFDTALAPEPPQSAAKKPVKGR